MASLMASFGYNMSGQFIARIISFLINMYLLRIIDNDVLGLVNVRLTLLYTTVLFLTREPMRKGHIMRESLPKFINLIWLSPLISIILSFICIFFWYAFSSTTENVSTSVLLSFPISAIIEAFGEPFAVISLRFSLARHFAISQGILVCAKRIFVLFALFLFPNVYHLDLFAYAQYFGAILYLIFHVLSFHLYIRNQSSPELNENFKSFNDFMPKISEGIDFESAKSAATMFSHSILKQFLTDGSSYVMTFTELLSLKHQAVYDAVERVGSIVARTVLAPMEENCYAHFSNKIRKESSVFEKNNDNHDELIKTLSTILHVVGVIGCVACVFGIPYSPTAIYLYGGNLLSQNNGALLLSLYSIYIFVMAVNGITECFAMTTMENYQVVSHGKFLFGAAISHLSINYILCFYINSAGFITANIINMIIRICYSWHHIQKYFGKKSPSIFVVFPTTGTLMFLFATFFATSFSYLIFATTPGLSHTLAHLAIGGVLFLILALNISQHDSVFASIIHDALKKHQN